MVGLAVVGLAVVGLAVVGLAGFEPATSATQTRRASQTALQPVLQSESSGSAAPGGFRAVRDPACARKASSAGRVSVIGDS